MVELLACCKHMRAIVPIQLVFLACEDPIFEIEELDMTALIRTDHRLPSFHLNNTLLKVEHTHGMVDHPSSICRKLG